MEASEEVTGGKNSCSLFTDDLLQLNSYTSGQKSNINKISRDDRTVKIIIHEIWNWTQDPIYMKYNQNKHRYISNNSRQTKVGRENKETIFTPNIFLPFSLHSDWIPNILIKLTNAICFSYRGNRKEKEQISNTNQYSNHIFSLLKSQTIN